MSDARAVSQRHSAPRAGIVVTGTEVLTGRVSDRNGPWLAEQLRAEGIDVAQVVVVGDRPDDLRAALAFFAGSGASLVLTSGGLGPTADDLTAEVVAGFQGRPMSFDEDLERRIAGIVERISRNRGWRMDPEATAAATRKQAMVPDGATVLAPVGTAPGLVVPPTGDGPPVVVLPGPSPRAAGHVAGGAGRPPRCWPRSTAAASCGRRRSGCGGRPNRSCRRPCGGTRVSSTVSRSRPCLRSGELEIVSRYAPEAQPAQDRLGAALAADFGDQLFSPDGAGIDEIVAGLLLGRAMTIATAESCTAGLLAGRLTDLGRLVGLRPRRPRHVLQRGQDGARRRARRADQATRRRQRRGCRRDGGRRAPAPGVRRRGSASRAWPVRAAGRRPSRWVWCTCASAPAEEHLAREIHVPGSRADVRQRTVVVALHMIRTLLTR